MGIGIESKVFYFDKGGPANTDKALDIALACCEERNIGKIVVASSTGKTALELHQKAKASIEIVAVTYCAGSSNRKAVEEFNTNRDALLEKEIRIVRGLHALSGVEKAFQSKYKGGILPLFIVADTLRMFSQGTKVCVEIALMAVEHGYINPEEEVVVIGGSGHGADTAVVMKPAFAANMFDTNIRAVLCMPA